MALFKNLNFDKLKDGLKKTRSKIVDRISESLSGKAKIDEEVLEEIEEILLTSDVGYDTALDIIEETRKAVSNQDEREKDNVFEIIKTELSKRLDKYKKDTSLEDEIKKHSPWVLLIVGVNGAGKTTTVGKLAHNFKQSGLKVVIGSADTFRAAANEQLDIWAKRAGVEIFQSESGADPSAVAFETIQKAKDDKADIVLIDTAGRLHTKSNLMEELKKIKRVMAKVLPYAPNETFLVVDGNAGQNVLHQAREFQKFTELTGLIITKLDGTAKGGVVFQVSSELKVPVRYIGVGEGIDDLQNFDSESFVKALFGK